MKYYSTKNRSSFKFKTQSNRINFTIYFPLSFILSCGVCNCILYLQKYDIYMCVCVCVCVCQNEDLHDILDGLNQNLKPPHFFLPVLLHFHSQQYYGPSLIRLSPPRKMPQPSQFSFHTA